LSQSSIYKTCEIVCKEIDVNCISSNRLAFKLEYNLVDDLTHLVTLIKEKMQGLVTNIQRECKHDIRTYPSLFDNNDNMNRKFKYQAHFYIDLMDNINLDETSRNAIINHCWEFIRNIKSISHTHDYSITLQELI
jgi:hypothetical protein